MFAPVLKLAIDFSASTKNGFKACGLFPFDSNAVNYNILNKEKRNKNIFCASDSNDFSEKKSKNKQLLTLFETKIISSDILITFKENEFKQSWTAHWSKKNFLNLGSE